MDDGFSAYTVRGEGSSCEVEELTTHLIMTCNDELSVSAAKSTKYGKGLRATINFLNIRGVTL